jgi:geranylgeranyl pyrophosphate synthase
MSSAGDTEGQWLAEILREYAPAAGAGMEPRLRSALDQSVSSTGSLLRARLVAVGGRSHGLATTLAGQLACAVEYFHTASLLLDDLPCMDDASVRRGQPCVHRAHGEATAILAALALINRAHVLVGLALAAHPPAVRVQATLLLDDTLGVMGLIGGQARDLRFGEVSSGSREVGQIAAAKTGALFKLALVLPVLPAEPGPAEFRFLKALALYWGQWFQANDDLRDVIASSATVGKDTQRDSELARPNLALVLGVGGVGRRLARLETQIEGTVNRLRARGAQWDYLREFHGALTERTRVRAA